MNLFTQKDMYPIILHIHDMLRWALLILFILVIVKSFAGWLGKKAWSKSDSIFGTVLTAAYDLQFLIGIVLYAFFSPLVKAAFADFGAAMKTSSLRFIAVEHIFIMFLALIVVHIGKAKSKRAKVAVKKHKLMAIFTSIALVLVLAGIPWERLFT